MNLFKWRNGSGNNTPQSGNTQPTKQSYTPFVKGIAQLVDEGPPRVDGSDKFFGMENVVNGEKFGNTCYCNSILQSLYFSKPFRECVVNYPQRSMLSCNDICSVSSTFIPPTTANGNGSTGPPVGGKATLTRINTDPTALGLTATSPNSTVRSGKSPLSPTTPKDDSKRKSIPMIAAVQIAPSGKLEDPNSPEAKKKAALVNGPLLKVDASNFSSYGMHESLFSALKDIFETIITHTSRTGVISPLKFVEILKRENEMFRSSVHQDAHEFLNYVLNQIIENVEQYQKKVLSAARANGNAIQPSQLLPTKALGSVTPASDSSAASTASGTTSSALSSLSAGWIHDLFEGLLTSETKCLTCETVSRRDEVFLDLSIDLDKHTSVTSCLNNFSASEMLCERNKFHCDCCGGLQEAEKRMKIKRLPRILALHLKRFKYSEEMGRHQKLFHRVVYPYYLRLFNTTDDAEDPDKLYELYAVVVHIGGGPYHGHYVTIVKTEDKGWLLFDDELVEPVDKSYVRNFFGDEKKLACAYVLFYQETTFERMQKEMNEELAEKAPAAASVPLDDVSALDSAVLKEKGVVNGDVAHLQVDDHIERPPLSHSLTTPLSPTPDTGRTPAEIAAEHLVVSKSKKDRERERKEEKAAEKAAAKAAKLASEEVPNGESNKDKEKPFGRFRTTSKSLSRGHSWFGGSGTHGREKEKERKSYENGALNGHWDDHANHHHEPTTITNGNGNATEGRGKSHEGVPADAAKEVPQDEQRDIPLSNPPPPPQSHSTQPLPPLPSLAAGKPPKEKRKGLWSGLKRKTSIMMNDA